MSRVIIKTCENYGIDPLKERIQEGIDLSGGWRRYFSPGQTVLLKVNLIGPKKPQQAATTHPEFVRAVGQLVREHGGIVSLGDSSGGAIAGMAPTRKSFGVSGLAAMAEQEGFSLVNFDEAGPVECPVPGEDGRTLYLSKALMETDVVINLPKLKTHSMGFYTGAVKNLFGAIPGLRKAHYHRDSPNPVAFGQVLADLHRVITNMPLHIMDGIVAMEGEGPTAGKPYPAGRILISEDPLALDRIAIGMMGMDPERVDILKASVEAGIGTWDPAGIEVVGEASRLKGFHPPKRYISGKVPDYTRVRGVIDFFKTVPVIDIEPCIDCRLCVESCPVEAIDPETKRIDYEVCIDCLCCHELCMVEAVRLQSTKRSVDVIRNLAGIFHR